MNLPRGFRTEANAYAREFREELGLQPHAPLSPWALAEHLAIPVVALSDFSSEIPAEVCCLLGRERSSFSAATVFRGRRRLIVHNDAHHPRRQASNIAHELSHGILGHPLTPPLNDHGCRHFDKAIEDEANWLGPALLISEEAALFIVERGLSMPDAIRIYGVSEQIITMRINIIGARKRIARRNKFRRRTA